MITTKNYFKEVERIGVKDLPETLRKSHELVEKVTQNGTTWNTYNSNDTIKRMVDLYITKLNEYASKQKPSEKVKSPAPVTKKASKPRQATKAKEKTVKVTPRPVERVTDAVTLLKRYVNFHNKIKNESQVLNLLNALQKAIIEKRIGKDSPYSSEIAQMQDNLVKLYETMSGSAKVVLSEKTVEHLKRVTGAVAQMYVVRLIKRYIGMQGKSPALDKVKRLRDEFQKYFDTLVTDKYNPYATTAVNSLNDYLQQIVSLKNKSAKIKPFNDIELSGLAGLGLIVNKRVKGSQRCRDGKYTTSKNPGRGSHHGGVGFIPTIIAAAAGGAVQAITQKAINRNGVSGAEDSGKMSLNQAKNMKFDKAGLTGEWKALLGDICLPTTLFFYGPGGSKKSTGAIRLAEKLNNLGKKVLYVAAEQYGTPTFTALLSYLNPQVNESTFEIVRDLTVSDPSKFDVIVLDSKDASGFKHSDQFEEFKKRFPKQSFIITSKAIKSGNFKGDEAWRNNVDTMVYFENGVARTDEDKNRWGGSGTMVVK
ncbi:MAG: hypothetical protein WAQ28_03545 [Bacteroidia bacterium]